MSRGTNVRKENGRAMRGELLVFQGEVVLSDKMDMLGLGIESVKVHTPSIGTLGP